MDERITTLIEALSGDGVTDETRATQLAELSDEDLAALEADLLAHFQAIRAGEVDEIERDDLTALRRVAGCVEHLRVEAGRRIEAAEAAEVEAAAREQEAADLEATLLATEPETAPASEEPPAEPAPEASEAGEETPEAEATDPVAEPTVEAEPEPVAASAPARPSLAALAATRATPEAAPAPAPALTRPRWQSMDGQPIRDLHDAAERITEAMSDSFEVMPGKKIRVARMRAEFPEDRRVTALDEYGAVTRKMDALTQDATAPGTWPEAVVASGGWCAPLEPQYDVMTVASAARPFRGGLPTLGVDRGGIRHIRSAGISEITTSGASAGVGIWEAATDETPGESTKSRQTAACPTVVDVELGAIYRRMRFGNFEARAFPEAVDATLTNLLSAHASLGETEGIDDLIAAMNTDITEAAVLGASRDLLEAWNRAAVTMRHNERMDPNARLRLVAPYWVVGMFQADILRQQASGELQAFTEPTEAWIRSILNTYNLNVTFTMDAPTGGAEPGLLADNTNLPNWTATVIWQMFPEGSVVFLDGGILDLGIVRDSTLNNTNDYEIFAETFEGVAYKGPVGISVTSTVCPNGESQVATDETGNVCDVS